MRFLLAFALCFVSVFASAQAPMVLGGPQGIDVTRILARNWMSIPTYTDTPAAPLTGSGWPARGFIIHVAKSGDTAVWQYTGKKWAKIGGVAENNYTYLVSGGGYTKALSSNNITVLASTYYIKGLLYSSNTVFVSGFPKTANANGRIDAVVLGPSGASIIQGTESANPASPSIPDTRLKIGFIYYQPFDTLPQVTGNELTSVFRKPGRDSLYFTSGETTIAVKDSIGISRNDTASMLTNYVNTASNGLTKTGKDIRLGGTLNQSTRIALGGNAINIAGSADSTRFFGNGSVAVGYRPNQSPYPDDSTYRFAVNGTSRLNGVVTYKGDLLPQNTPNAYTLGITQGSSFGALRAYTNGGASSMQQLEFGYLNTSLNTTGGLSNPTHSNFGLRVYGSLSAVDSGGGSYTNFRISPTINYNTNFKKAFHMGFSYEPTVQSLNNTTHIAFRNTRGSNLFNVNSGNTLIGYDTTSAGYQVDTTYKLDVNGNMRVGRIFYGANNIDTPLVIRKANETGVARGVYIGGANSFSTNVNANYLLGDRNNLTGTTSAATVIGRENEIDSSSCIVLGNLNSIPNPTTDHIIIGERNTGNSYTNTQNASILIGLSNNTNGYWGSGLIGSYLKYYENGQLAFGHGTTNGTLNFATKNVYFGNGVKNEGNRSIDQNFGHGPDVAINPSWANDVDSANRNGGSLTIAGGRGTGTGTPGTVRFSTWNTTTSGSTLHPTLTERARISPTGNLLVGRTVDSIYKLDVNGDLSGIRSNVPKNSAYNGLQIKNTSNETLLEVNGLGTTSIGYGSNNVTINGTPIRMNVNGSQNASIFTVSGSDNLSAGLRFQGNYGSSRKLSIGAGVNNNQGVYYDPNVRFGIFKGDFEDTTSPTLICTPNNNVLIGRTVDSIYKLDVNGQSRFTNHVNITNGGYLKIPDNNKIQLGVNGPSQNYNTFITSVVPSSEGDKNTHIGYVDGYTGNSGTDNTIIGSVNNRTNVTGSSNVIVGTNNRNYFNGTCTQNNSIIIGQGMYTPDAFNTNQVGYFGFDGSAIGGTLSSHLGFFSGFESRESNAIVFGRSGTGNATYNNVYFNGVRGVAGNAGNSITLNAASAGNATDRNGGNITIAGGKGTGNGTPGAIIFSTSTRLPNTADTTTLQTLSERARISERGNLLVGTTTDNSSAIVNISSTTQGFLPPRMTGAQAELIGSPAEGLMIYSTDGTGATITSKGWWGYNGSTWVKLN